MTPFMWAAMHGHVKCIKVLLAAGADVTLKTVPGSIKFVAKEVGGRTALDLCIQGMKGLNQARFKPTQEALDLLQPAKK